MGKCASGEKTWSQTAGDALAAAEDGLLVAIGLERHGVRVGRGADQRSGDPVGSAPQQNGNWSVQATLFSFSARRRRTAPAGVANGPSDLSALALRRAPLQVSLPVGETYKFMAGSS
jgi:hypothetical protein